MAADLWHPHRLSTLGDLELVINLEVQSSKALDLNKV